MRPAAANKTEQKPKQNHANQENSHDSLTKIQTNAGNSDYALEVFRAMEEVWDGTGVFVFTSSGSVYAENKGGVVTEDSPIDEAKVDSPLRSESKLGHGRRGDMYEDGCTEKVLTSRACSFGIFARESWATRGRTGGASRWNKFGFVVAVLSSFACCEALFFLCT